MDDVSDTGSSDTQGNPSEVGAKKTILIVEDDQVLMKMYVQKLTSVGYNVLTAIDGEEAGDVFKKNKIDLVITDIMLPRVSGIEFLEKLRKTPKGKKVPVIAWSNLAREEDKNRVVDLGAQEYIVKGTLSLEQMAETVKKYLV